VATLYEIRGDCIALDEILLECDGDITAPEAEKVVMKWFDEVGEDLTDKLEAYGEVIREMESRALVRRMEGERLLAQAKVQENSAEGLKERLLWFMNDRGLGKVETDKFRFSVAKNGGQLPLIIDEARVPEHFQRQEWFIDKDKIREHLMAPHGEYLSTFASFGERGQHLRIK
jgi:hypothetical protein